MYYEPYTEQSLFSRYIIFKPKTTVVVGFKKIMKLKKIPPGLDGYFMFTDRLCIQ